MRSDMSHCILRGEGHSPMLKESLHKREKDARENLSRALIRNLIKGKYSGTPLKESGAVSYLVENVLPTLIPGLIDLLRVLEQKQRMTIRGIKVEETNPLTWLASYLFRNNKLYIKNVESKCFEDETKSGIERLINSERRLILQEAVIEDMKSPMKSRRYIHKISPWANGKDSTTVSLNGERLDYILQELQDASGLKQFRHRLRDLLLELDTRGTGTVQISELANVISGWMKALVKGQTFLASWEESMVLEQKEKAAKITKTMSTN